MLNPRKEPKEESEEWRVNIYCFSGRIPRGHRRLCRRPTRVSLALTIAPTKRAVRPAFRIAQNPQDFSETRPKWSAFGTKIRTFDFLCISGAKPVKEEYFFANRYSPLPQSGTALWNEAEVIFTARGGSYHAGT